MTTKHRQCSTMSIEQFTELLKTHGGLPFNQWVYHVTFNPHRGTVTVYSTNGTDTEDPEGSECRNVPLYFQHPKVWEVEVPCLTKRFYFWYKPTTQDLFDIASSQNIYGGSINTIEGIRNYFSIHELIINYPPKK